MFLSSQGLLPCSSQPHTSNSGASCFTTHQSRPQTPQLPSFPQNVAFCSGHRTPRGGPAQQVRSLVESTLTLCLIILHHGRTRGPVRPLSLLCCPSSQQAQPRPRACSSSPHRLTGHPGGRLGPGLKRRASSSALTGPFLLLRAMAYVPGFPPHLSFLLEVREQVLSSIK